MKKDAFINVRVDEKYKKAFDDRAKALAEAINFTDGKTNPRKFSKIVSLYAKGDIDYDVALYAIKQSIKNDKTVVGLVRKILWKAFLKQSILQDN